MKIKILMENRAAEERFACDHGLSVYIETAGHKILMDAGPDRRFAENAALMGVDIAAVDTVVLSHGHYDHAGGLTRFFELNDSAKVYAASGYALPHYDENGAYIGVEPLLVDNPRITVLDQDLKIDDEISIITFRGKALVRKIDTCEMTEGSVDGMKRVKLYPEKFTHEHYLLVNDGGKKVLFSGCSHKGIVNIASWAREYSPDAIVGGFHLMGVQKENYHVLEDISAELLKSGIDYYTGHCTGADQFEYMKTLMGGRLHYAASGSQFEI